jgi:hypothetical protein
MVFTLWIVGEVKKEAKLFLKWVATERTKLRVPTQPGKVTPKNLKSKTNDLSMDNI